MNFLPLIFIFLLIFSVLSMSFTSSQTADKTENLSYMGRFRALRNAYNEREEALYDRKKRNSNSPPRPAVQLSTQRQSDEQSELEEKTYFRITRTGSPLGAINLSKLIRENWDESSDWLYDKTAKYLERIYGNASFVKEMKNSNWAKELLNFLIEKKRESIRERQKKFSLDTLCPEGPLKVYYYKLIRGTNSFNLETQRGYLPLKACICFDEIDKNALRFPFANPAMLIVFLGQEQFAKIKEKEWPQGRPRRRTHQSNYALQPEELKILLGDSVDPRVYEFFDFSYSTNYKTPKRSTDPSTYISAQLWEGAKGE